MLRAVRRVRRRSLRWSLITAYLRALRSPSRRYRRAPAGSSGSRSPRTVSSTSCGMPLEEPRLVFDDRRLRERIAPSEKAACSSARSSAPVDVRRDGSPRSQTVDVNVLMTSETSAGRRSHRARAVTQPRTQEQLCHDLDCSAHPGDHLGQRGLLARGAEARFTERPRAPQSRRSSARTTARCSSTRSRTCRWPMQVKSFASGREGARGASSSDGMMPVSFRVVAAAGKWLRTLKTRASSAAATAAAA